MLIAKYLLWLLSQLLAVSLASDIVGISCDRNPDLPFCAKVHGAPTSHRRVRASEVSEKDKIACRELGDEYAEKCKGKVQEPEFCKAFENICFKVGDSAPVGKSRVQSELEEFDGVEEEKASPRKNEELPSEPIPITSDPSSSPQSNNGRKKKKRINFTKFCKDFKNRYLYICPDPFKFGQKAVLFCPIYSEHCHVPLPDKPVLPERKGHKGGAISRLCAAYRGYADNYCNNALLLAQQNIREGCEKYWRFCLKRRNG